MVLKQEDLSAAFFVSLINGNILFYPEGMIIKRFLAQTAITTR